MTTPNGIPSSVNNVIELDKKLRTDITQYFFALQKMNDPSRAIELLAGHVAIMVEMINDFKKRG